jgi:hypothetical protein
MWVGREPLLPAVSCDIEPFFTIVHFIHFHVNTLAPQFEIRECISLLWILFRRRFENKSLTSVRHNELQLQVIK